MKTINKTFSIIIFLLLANSLQSQVGINTTDPSAALEITSKSKGTSKYDLNIKNSDQASVLKVSNTGDLFFSKALMPNGDAGNTAKYLVSQGANLPPIWKELKKATTVQIFSAQKNDISTRLINQLENYTLEFPVINSMPEANYGTWNASTNRFIVNKKGIYNITVGLDGDDFKTNNTPNPSGNLALFIMTPNTSPTGAIYTYRKATNKYNVSTTVTYSAILNPNDYIYTSANSGNSSWHQGPSFISIQYSEIP